MQNFRKDWRTAALSQALHECARCRVAMYRDMRAIVRPKSLAGFAHLRGPQENARPVLS
jgi:hypothetical protein